jgi:serine/threonine protein kinase
MGVVYEALQIRPLRRRVALKVIKRGMDTNKVTARFESERQALALMTHTNIAKVLDAGETEDGRPYFVMELVRGVRLDEYCDNKRLTIRERLELFLEVCAAVHHAHQRGVIHRDIKPSNMLVAVCDGKAIPKIIDFGIAKATTEPLTNHSMLTEIGQFIGTPEYMSPEQAAVDCLDIDVRTDVYSLGVVLYQLLSGSTPGESKLNTPDLGELRQRIQTRDARRPSSQVSTLENSAEVLRPWRRIASAATRQLRSSAPTSVDTSKIDLSRPALRRCSTARASLLAGTVSISGLVWRSRFSPLD